MKSICFVTTSPYAVNFFVLGHLRELAERYRVTVCTNLAAYPLTADLDPRIAVIDLPIARKIAPWSDLAALFRLLAIFYHSDFDAVHSLTPKAGLLAMAAAMFCRVPLRVHVFTGQVWATAGGLKRAVLKAMDRLTVAFSTTVFSDSSSQSRLIERELRLAPGRVGVFGKGSVSGVDVTRFRPDATRRRQVRAELSTTDTDFVFLFVGRLARDKGVFDLIAAFRELRARRDDVVLWVVGPDEENRQDELKACAGDAEPWIRWVGATFTPEIQMAAADLLVLPSYREGFGLVVVEAAACGVPAVAYRIDGVVDAVIDGETGELVSPGDVIMLGLRMAALAADPVRARTLGAAARQRVARDFTAAAVTRAWVGFYEKMI